VFDPTVTHGALITWLFNFDLTPDGRGFSLQNLRYIFVSMQLKSQMENFSGQLSIISYSEGCLLQAGFPFVQDFFEQAGITTHSRHDRFTYLRFHTTAGFPWRTSINSSILGSESFPADSEIRAQHIRLNNKAISNHPEHLCFKSISNSKY
jgi:hypothetical protein